MPPATFRDPAAAREFATDVVRRLRQAGHETYWAGGCVRDELLGRIPADYDVATAATPAEVRAVFGHPRTLAIGASFGVITVLGPKPAGQVEVATFRSDAPYTDGRHPAGVTFCSAREDAQRRDFTINGLFLDPLSGQVHDFVDGRRDLADGIVRAIGIPAMRFGEDHLRMLRAVRFTAFFGFVLEGHTRAAIDAMAPMVAAVSPERIASELRAMVARQGRRQAVELLLDTGLARVVLPELAPPVVAGAAWRRAAAIIAACDEPALPMALATLAEAAGETSLPATTARLRLSNHESRDAEWLRAGVAAIEGGECPTTRPWSQLQRWAADDRAAALADVLRARAACGGADPARARWFSERSGRPRHELDPPPLVTGSDLLAAGIPPGRAIGATLARLRALQLDGVISTREQALEAAACGQ